ncbi:MAG: serine hydrolase [Xanthomonadales bacterium]|nr:serine hydrolase [Xanthomonadales bacterium]
MKIIRVLSVSSAVILPALLMLGLTASCPLLAGQEGQSLEQQPIGSVREIYDGSMADDLRVNTFRNIDRLFPTRIVARGPKISELPVQLRSVEDFSFTSGESEFDLVDVMTLNAVTGLLILHHGEIVYEQYQRGNDQHTRWMSMSVVKSMTAALIGAAIQDGHIESIDDPLVRYLPKLKGSAYEGVTVRQVLLMASGVGWNETYTDPTSDRRQMLEAQISQQADAILDLMASLPRAAEPGTLWNYSTGETQFAGALVHAATGKWVADYLSEKIWVPQGMEYDASWWLESPNGLEIGGSGLSATLRDYARFGLFMLNDGVINGQRVLPEGWMAEAGARHSIGGKEVEYGYMLWPLHGRSYSAIGIFGQFVFVDPDSDLVVAMWSAQPKPVGKHGVDEYEFLQALSSYFD